jgi:hypothetical protein
MIDLSRTASILLRFLAPFVLSFYDVLFFFFFFKMNKSFIDQTKTPTHQQAGQLSTQKGLQPKEKYNQQPLHKHFSTTTQKQHQK